MDQHFTIPTSTAIPPTSTAIAGASFPSLPTHPQHGLSPHGISQYGQSQYGQSPQCDASYPVLFSDSSKPGNPLNDVFNRLLEDRIVVLGTEVHDEVANLVMAQLLYLESQDSVRPIWLYINSPGGSVTAGMAIYDTMQFVRPEVGTVCIGLGASMGQFLLCAGSKGKRYALPHARVMMHQPLGRVKGQATDIAIQAEQMAYTKRLLQERISYHTGQTVTQVEKDSDRDRWFTAEEAKEYGIVDHVIVKRGEMR